MKTVGQIEVRIKTVKVAEKTEIAAINRKIDLLDDDLLADGDEIETETLEYLHTEKTRISAKWNQYISALQWVME